MKNKNNRKRYLKISLITSLVITFILTYILKRLFGEKLSYDYIFWIFIIIFIIVFFFNLAVLLIVFGATDGEIVVFGATDGEIGEYRVSRVLESLKNTYGGYIINDVIIPNKHNNKTSQIDHIYFSRYGIFVIETKNYSGRIYGNDKNEYWTQVLLYGEDKNKFYNPIMQNNTHIRRLKELLNIDRELYCIVVFVQGNTEFINSDYVYTLDELENMVDNSEIEYTEEELERYYNIVQKYKDNPIQTNKEHIAEIKETIEEMKYKCPRCGGSLVLRRSKNGYEFYGCENFPKCRYIKKT